VVVPLGLRLVPLTETRAKQLHGDLNAVAYARLGLAGWSLR